MAQHILLIISYFFKSLIIKLDGTCRYGTLCTFAHGDTEVRSKNENILRVQQQMFPFMDMNPMMTPMNMPYPPMMNPFMMPPMDPSQMGYFGGQDPQNFEMDPTKMPNPMVFNPMVNFPNTKGFHSANMSSGNNNA